jgi:DNA-binding FadR family transcriptional regulator
MINPQPGAALYAQVAAELRKDIRSGRIPPGKPLPSEKTMQQQYGVSRETVRKAVALLRAEGLVAVRQGHGSYVREQPDLETLTPPAGSEVTARMPTAEERGQLGIGEGVPVFWIIHPDGSARAYAADQYSIRMP